GGGAADARPPRRDAGPAIPQTGHGTARGSAAPARRIGFNQEDSLLLVRPDVEASAPDAARRHRLLEQRQRIAEGGQRLVVRGRAGYAHQPLPGGQAAAHVVRDAVDAVDDLVLVLVAVKQGDPRERLLA